MRSIILLTDSIPSADGAGISQTLYNLLDQYNVNIELITRPGGEQSNSLNLPVRRFDWQFESFAYWNNRLGKWLNPVLVSQNFSRQQKKIKEIRGISIPQNAFVFVSTTEPIKLQLAWLLQQQFGYAVVPYFMDDWLATNKLKWKGGNIQQVAKDILQAAPCWLMISRQLEKTFRERYRLQKKPCLVVHNPSPAPYTLPIEKERAAVQLAQLSSEIRNLPASTPVRVKHSGGADQAGQKSEIIYAGSIWPMHADALIATAKAVHLMQETSSVVGRRSSVVPGLIIYTGEAHWKKYRSQLEGPGVTYGGWKSYADIQKILPSAWLLLCSASFDGKHKAYSDSSVQTKLTDYMAAGKPVLFVGPSEAASGVFVEEWDIGFTVATQLPSDIAASLEAISRMDKAYDRKANNGAVLATTTFSKPVVQQKLYDFLEQYAMPAQVTGSSV